MKKIFSMRKIKFLLATIMMIAGTAVQATTITWDAAKLTSMRTVIESTVPASQSKTSDGITVTVAKTVSSAISYTMEFGSDIMANTQGYFTFESSVGNISKIEINHSSFGSWDSGGTGWPSNYSDYDGGGTFTWSGTPAASVTLTGNQGDAFASISSIVFTIEDPTVAVTGVTLSQTEAALNIGESVTLTPTVLPDNATDKTVTWTSSDATVATVSVEGVVTAVAAGTATITVTATNGTDDTADDKTATCTVTVAEPTYTVTVKEGTEDAANWTITPSEGLSEGDPVTIQYNGTRRVRSITAVKKAASTPLDNTTTAWASGAFAVPAGGLTYSDAITVSGNVTLVLTDGETLTLNKGISLAEGATLTVQGNGTMNVNGTSGSTASTVAGSGTLVLTSGTLTATGGNGGGYGGREATRGSKSAGGVAINGTVTVSGGTLTATGGAGGSIGEYNANVTAGAGGAAISGSVTFNSGTLTATGGNGGNGDQYSTGYAGAGGAAIGGDLTVNGGTLTTTDGSNGVQLSDMCAVTVGAGGKAVAGTVTDNR